MKPVVIIMLLLAGALFVAPTWGLDVNDAQSVAAETALIYDEHEGSWYLRAPGVSFWILDDPTPPEKVMSTSDGPVNIDRLAHLLPINASLYAYCMYGYEIRGELLSEKTSWQLIMMISVRCDPKRTNKAASLLLRHAWNAGTSLSIVDSFPPLNSTFEQDLPFAVQVVDLQLPIDTLRKWTTQGRVEIKLSRYRHSPSDGIVVTIPSGYLEGIWSVFQTWAQSRKE